MPIKIPRTTPSRAGQPTYAQLVMKVYPDRIVQVFEGRMFKTGELVAEAQLRPSQEYPETPLLIEFAGNDRSGRGHRRSNDIHVLWKYDRQSKSWIQLAHVRGQGREWIESLKPIVIRELARPDVPANEIAWSASRRVLQFLDDELQQLTREGKSLLMSFLHDEFIARVVAWIG